MKGFCVFSLEKTKSNNTHKYDLNIFFNNLINAHSLMQKCNVRRSATIFSCLRLGTINCICILILSMGITSTYYTESTRISEYNQSSGVHNLLPIFFIKFAKRCSVHSYRCQHFFNVTTPNALKSKGR